MAGSPNNNAKQLPAGATGSTWQSMKWLRQHYWKHSAMLMIYQSLWDKTQGQAGSISTTAAAISDDVGGMAPRTVWGHLNKLKDLRLVEFPDRDKWTGVIIIYVRDHRELGMPRRVDSPPAEDPALPGFEVTTQEADTADGEMNTPIVDTVPMQTSAGRLGLAGVSDQKPPRAETPAIAAASGFESRKSLSDQRLRIRSSPPPDDRHVVSDHGTLDRRTLNINLAPLEQPDTLDHGGAGVSAAAIDARDMVEFHRRRALEHDRAHASDPTHIAQPLTAAILRLGDCVDRATTPAEQKSKLVAYIKRRVADARMDRSIPGRVADYVLHDGLSFEVLNECLDKLDREDRRGAVDARFAWFRGGIETRIAALRIPSRDPRVIGRRGKQNLHSHPPGHGRPEIPRAP
jgi:DNA-binding transcriptional ArsR family regulator